MVTEAERIPVSRWQVLRAYLVLPHAVPILVVLASTATFALIAAHGWPGTSEMIWLLLAMLGGQVLIGVVNELVDADLDAIAKPDKPIPAGLVSRRGAQVLMGESILLMTGAGLTFGFPSFPILVAGT